MKSYTDLEQSKKLAEILPLESADMWWNFYSVITDDTTPQIIHLDIPWASSFNWANKPDNIPCWSLAALLEQLKSEIRLENKQILYLHLNKYDDTDYEIRYTNSWTGEVLIIEVDNLVDACVAMVEKLHELNLLLL